MRKSFGFVILMFFVSMMGCGGGAPAGNNGGSPQIPAAPTALTATVANGQVSLSWTGSANASGYHVKRGSASGGPYTLLATSTQASYADTSVSMGTTYYYVVTAYNSAGESGNSNEASATLPRTSHDLLRLAHGQRLRAGNAGAALRHRPAWGQSALCGRHAHPARRQLSRERDRGALRHGQRAHHSRRLSRRNRRR